MKNILITLIFLSFSLILPANNYYVASAGSNSNTGTIALPFLTIQYGLNVLTPGDSLFVRAGSYAEKIYWNNSGTTGLPVVLTNYPGEVATITSDGSSEIALITISSKSHISIDGMVLDNNFLLDAKGIYVVGGGENISIKNCTLSNIGWTSDPTADPTTNNPIGQAHGILINGRTTAGYQDISIENCTLHDLITGNSEAMTLVGNVYNFKIQGCTIYDTKNIAIDVAGHFTWAVDVGVDPTLNQCRSGSITECLVYNNRRINNIDAPAGIYADGAKDVIIARNTSYQNGIGISVGCENAGFSASGIIVHNNLVYANDNPGIYFGANAGTIENCILKNNTFYENGTIGIFYSEVSLQNSTNCSVLQNIFIPRTNSHYAVSIFGYTVSNLTVDRNLAYRYTGDQTQLFITDTPAQFTPTNSITLDPLFTTTGTDFSLSNSSPAINQGDLGNGSYSSLDHAGNVRVVNGQQDHGALENATGGCPSTFTIATDQFLSGSFTASTKVILDLNNAALTDSVKIFSPELQLLSPVQLEGYLAHDKDGCN